MENECTSAPPADQAFRIHRMPLFDVTLAGHPQGRRSWVEVMRAGGASWGEWSLPDHTMGLAQAQLLTGLLSWAAQRLKLSWETLVGALQAGGEEWDRMVETLIQVLDTEPTDLTDPQQAPLQFPIDWVATDTPIEGLLAPFTITPDKKAKAFHVRRERIHQLCPGCALHALLRLHTNSALRAQYWSETPLARGAIAWTSHLHDAQEREHLVWTALLNLDLTTATPHAPWAQDPAAGHPYLVSWMRQQAQGQSCPPGFALLPMMRAARLGAFSEEPAACDLCQAMAPVVREFGLLPEPAVANRAFLGLPAPHDKASEEQQAPAKMFSRVGGNAERHPWTVWEITPGKKAEDPPRVLPQFIRAEQGVYALPTWVYLEKAIDSVIHVNQDHETGFPLSFRRLHLAAEMLQQTGCPVRQVWKAFATKPEKKNPNLAAMLDTSFDVSRLENAGEKTSLEAYHQTLKGCQAIVEAYRDAWIGFGKKAFLDSHQPLKSATGRPRPIDQAGVDASLNEWTKAGGRVLSDPVFITAVHDAWEQAAVGLGTYLLQEATDLEVFGQLSNQLQAIARRIKQECLQRLPEINDWARLHHAWRAYRRDVRKNLAHKNFSHLLSSPALEVAHA